MGLCTCVAFGTIVTQELCDMDGGELIILWRYCTEIYGLNVCVYVCMYVCVYVCIFYLLFKHA